MNQVKNVKKVDFREFG